MTDARGQHRLEAGDENAERIRAIMVRNPYAKPKDVVEATGLHRATVSRHLKALRLEVERARADG